MTNPEIKRANAVAEATLREMGAILSRCAADLAEHLRPFIEALAEARPEIGAMIYAERHRRGMTRREYADAHNVPIATLIRLERWRLIRNDGADVKGSNTPRGDKKGRKRNGTET